MCKRSAIFLKNICNIVSVRIVRIAAYGLGIYNGREGEASGAPWE